MRRKKIRKLVLLVRHPAQPASFRKLNGIYGAVAQADYDKLLGPATRRSDERTFLNFLYREPGETERTEDYTGAPYYSNRGSQG